MESNQRDPQRESIIGRDADQVQASSQATQGETGRQLVGEHHLEIEFESEIPEEGGEA